MNTKEMQAVERLSHDLKVSTLAFRVEIAAKRQESRMARRAREDARRVALLQEEREQ